jgi:hypothetical protein
VSNGNFQAYLRTETKNGLCARNNGRFLNYLLEADPSLPRPDAVSGANDGEWITEEEAHRREVASKNVPSLEEMLKDPDVRFVLEVTGDLEDIEASLKTDSASA